MAGRFPLTVKPSKSRGAMDQPLRMRRRLEQAEETMIGNVRRGDSNALNLQPCSCVIVSDHTAFRLVVPCKRHQKLKVTLKG